MSKKRYECKMLLLAIAMMGAYCLPRHVAAQQRTRPPEEFIQWLQISEFDRQLKNAIVKKDSGAEILLWRVHVVDEYVGDGLQRVLYNYVRMKIFNADGKEKAGTVDLPYKDSNILDVSGRTIKPDGSIIELDRKSVYKQDLVRASGRKEKVVSFAMPGVEPGAILEYRWKQSQSNNRFRYLRLEFGQELPIQKITYFLRPLSSEWVASDQMYILPFNCSNSPLEVNREGWVETTITNIPAFQDEPYVPTDPNVQPWALLYYRPEGTKDAQKYWNEEAKKSYAQFKKLLKANDEQKSIVARAIEGAKDDEEKITALAKYVQQSIRSAFDPAVTETERMDFLKNFPDDRERTSAEILKSKMALPNEMNVALAALALQAGLDIRLVMVANRNEVSVDPKAFPERYFVDDLALGIKSGTGWKIFSASSRNLYPGMLDADNQGMAAIIADTKSAIFMVTPISPPESSMDSRNATLKLSATGSLSGKVEEFYTGYEGEHYRSLLEPKSAAQRDEWFHDLMVKTFPDIEITELKMENIEDPAKPLTISYQMNAPQFAQIAGKRILFHPNAFRRSQPALFKTSERHNPIQFPFAWKETDLLHIVLPEGYELESAENPGNLNFGEAGGYSLTMSTDKTGTAMELIVSRELAFGADEMVYFPASSYRTLKNIFDKVQIRDTHTIALKEK
jgi:hypothetical protein